MNQTICFLFFERDVAFGYRVTKKSDLVLLCNRYMYGVGRTAMHLVARYGCKKAASALMRHRQLHVNALDKHHRAPLHVNAQFNRKEIVAMLISHPHIHPNVVDNIGQTPLHYASSRGCNGALEAILVHKQVNVNAQDNDGHTPLYIAARYGHVRCVRSLLRCKDLDPNIANLHNETPLHAAAKFKRVGVVHALVERGTARIDFLKEDAHGHTALTIADQHQFREISYLLAVATAQQIEDTSVVQQYPRHAYPTMNNRELF